MFQGHTKQFLSTFYGLFDLFLNLNGHIAISIFTLEIKTQVRETLYYSICSFATLFYIGHIVSLYIIKAETASFLKFC